MENNSTENIEVDRLDKTEYKTYPYRWVVLGIFMFVGAMSQVIWITFAGITDESAGFYGVSNGLILLLSLMFMLAYIPFNFLACWAIDRFGLKWGTGIGVIIMGVFGFLRPVIPGNYGWLLFCTIMTAIGQPFILNSFTKLAATWFPEKEKTLATGLGTMAMLLGVIITFLTAPMLLGADPNNPDPSTYRMNLTLYIFGGLMLLSMVLYLIFVKNKPPTPANAYSDKSKVLATQGTFSLFKNRDFTLLFLILFIGLGVFNAISSALDLIFEYPQGVDTPSYIAGVMIVGGIIGAIVFSTLSDKYQKRKIFIILAMFGGAIFTPLLIFADLMFTQQIAIDVFRYIVSFFYGLLLVSALPVGLTFAAEITHPVPEETSNGFMMWIGQVCGVILLGGMILTDKFNPGLMNISIYIMTGLFVIGIVLSFLMKDLDAYKL